jgi:hypothetical protein
MLANIHRTGRYGALKKSILDRFMQNSQRNRHLELLIVRSYVWALRAPRTIDGQKVASLSRHGLYEVRLLEPSEMAEDNDLPFWVELVDNRRIFPSTTMRETTLRKPQLQSNI